jgi:histidine triad (HIT) family protein
MLVLPRRHVQRFTELDHDEVTQLAGLLRNAVWAVKRAFGPDGTHVWTSTGVLAGQSLRHMHFQIVPRYQHEPYSFAPSDELPVTDYFERAEQAKRIRLFWPKEHAS